METAVEVGLLTRADPIEVLACGRPLDRVNPTALWHIRIAAARVTDRVLVEAREVSSRG